jgi:hypothetical protein
MRLPQFILNRFQLGLRLIDFDSHVLNGSTMPVRPLVDILSCVLTQTSARVPATPSSQIGDSSPLHLLCQDSQ